jgi:pimeloyl-ACP methyl ester carboxylesterase
VKPQVLCIPGGVAPAAQRYGPLAAVVGTEADLHVKDHEVYREDSPPAGYSIEDELEAIDRLADANGLDRFHLLGYSGGGFISLAYAGTRPARVITLALFEPARIPGPLTDEEQEFSSWLEGKLAGLQGPDFMATFVREQVKPGVETAPPAGPPSAEMRKRPAGIAAMSRAFNAYQFDRELLRTAPFTVFYAYGDLSHPEQATKAGVLAQLFTDMRVHRFAGVHHFVPPEQIYTPQHASMLVELWTEGEKPA